MIDSIYTTLKKEFPNLKKNILLKHHTTFSIGGPAKYFLVLHRKEELARALMLVKKLKVPFFILGGGSNLLVSDKGFLGLIIKIYQKDNIILKKNNIIEAPAGVLLQQLVDFSIKNSLEGLEWAGGLPGTFGGAIRGNAGAFGGETKDSIVEVLALDDNAKVRKLLHKQCQFSYRNSIFKKKNWIVLSAKVALKKGDKKSLSAIAASRVNYRQEKQPLELPNAGSIFKNCDVLLFSKEWQKDLAHVVKKDPFPVVPTAYLISEAGLKGTQIGMAQVSQKHPNFIVNLGGAKAQDVLELIS